MLPTEHVTPQALDELIASGNSPLLLDIRTAESRLAFPLEVRGAAPQLHVPLRRLLANLEAGEPGLPPPESAGRVVAFCERGQSSAVAARALRAAGYRAASLAGGVLAWSQMVFATVVPDSELLAPGALLIQLRRVGKGCLGYVLVSGGEALAVDAGRDVGSLVRLLDERGARLTRALDTHLHADHLSGGPAIARETGAIYGLPRDDARQAEILLEPVDDGAEWRVGRVLVRALHTPGHTDGSTSYVVGERFLLTGDTLFVRGIGRPDLSGQGQRLARALHRTLTETLAALPADLEILPAHLSGQDEIGAQGVAAVRLGDLQRGTLGALPRDADEFVRAVLGSLPEQPPNYEKIRQANQCGGTADDPAELEFGPNRCAVSMPH